MVETDSTVNHCQRVGERESSRQNIQRLQMFSPRTRSMQLVTFIFMDYGVHSELWRSRQQNCAIFYIFIFIYHFW